MSIRLIRPGSPCKIRYLNKEKKAFEWYEANFQSFVYDDYGPKRFMAIILFKNNYLGRVSIDDIEFEIYEGEELETTNASLTNFPDL